jgi:single-stranded-DNA-specific exonuclease
MRQPRLPNQRWQIASQNSELAQNLTVATGLLPIVTQVVINRGIDTPEFVRHFIEPESLSLPSPLEEFPDLAKSVALLQEAIEFNEKIAICGDYDADGMTSTALLLRALRHLGADVDYAIPSRMKDGYGINKRIVEEFANEGVGLILTVDNGIAAYEPISHAVDLGLSVIITDHHDLPPKLPPADAILNPKLLPITSPYWGLAGVGVAYVLAIATARSMDKLKGLTNPILELFTLGTIADLAPLIGVNRRWLKRGLRALPKSQLLGIQALMQVAGVNEEQKQLQPDDIGFKLGPRINAVGRIGNPQIVIELLTTDDPGIALEKAMQCEQINSDRQAKCEQIQQEAIDLVENTPISWKASRVLVVVKENWHHGVIGIVASRLVERYGVPVFIGTYEDEDTGFEETSKPLAVREEHHIIRGSARGIDEFNIFEALEYCRDLLDKFGGHKAAGGFSFAAQNLDAFQQRLSEFAHQSLEIEHLKPLIKIDAEASLSQINPNLYQQIDSLQPWGIGNPFPVFWTPNVQVTEQKTIGKNHLKLVLQEINSPQQIKAIAWRWQEYFPLPQYLDIAYKLKENNWQGTTNIELEIVGVRLPENSQNDLLITPTSKISIESKVNLLDDQIEQAVFNYEGRIYTCSLEASINKLQIRNQNGKILSINKGDRIGLLGIDRSAVREVNVTKPPYYQLIKAALGALKTNSNSPPIN